ncbi:MAG: dihydroorotate dehydrogenase [Desulfurococcus sp.]|uniref:iron-sulfur cluster-binding protein n=1 Tax=Desulfurococcus sp. TaxID=51678 RepID=UPI003167DC2F
MYYPAKITGSEKLSKTLYLKRIRILSDGIKEPLPFQFLLTWVPGVDLLPMSVADFSNGEVVIIVKERGEGSRALIRLHSGFLGVMGFYGVGFKPQGYKRILFVAGGSGIAPFFYLARKACEEGVSVDLVWGVRGGDELFNPRSLLNTVDKDVAIYVATEDCSTGYCGRASMLASRVIHENPGKWDLVIASGPQGLLREVCSLFNDTGVELYVNTETLVKCGVGACGSCVLKPHPLLLCRHGPVFKCRDIEGFLKGGGSA